MRRASTLDSWAVGVGKGVTAAPPFPRPHLPEPPWLKARVGTSLWQQLQPGLQPQRGGASLAGQ